MEPITENEIRASFVNCSKGDAKRLNVPRTLADTSWDELDFLGWTDPSYAGRAYLVVPRPDGPVGIAVRYETGGSDRAQMCTICMTMHSRGNVSLMTARKVGESGRKGNTVGTYMCTDLACPLYARGKKTPALGNRYRESLTPDERVERLQKNVDAFVDRLYT
ncbi:FBP domain-containing protein [Rhodococcoides yunnanense]|uniref:FBP domain-containing protein n=1 Tax=Rhodococcoides yunnanense TaxID=278209 RepID=UPI000934B4B1|nr:FBP domain-containing protein [Rhodococcus yunnanensis]